MTGTNANRTHRFTFTETAQAEHFEVHWAWVNEDAPGITWNIISVASLDELAVVCDILPEDVYVRYGAPEAWMARSRRVARMVATRERAVQAARDLADFEAVPF